MKAALLAESNARNALATARDAATAAEWDYHNTLLGAKNQVIAQYGDGSDQLQSLGLKKKSEHKSPARRKKALAKKTQPPSPSSQRTRRSSLIFSPTFGSLKEFNVGCSKRNG
jgi:hypothetical protein